MFVRAFTYFALGYHEIIPDRPCKIECPNKKVGSLGPNSGYKKKNDRQNGKTNMKQTGTPEVGMFGSHARDSSLYCIDVHPGQKTTGDQNNGGNCANVI